MNHNMKNRVIYVPFTAKIADYVIEVREWKSGRRAGKIEVLGNKTLPKALITAAKMWFANKSQFADLTLSEYLNMVFTETEVYDME